jgi:sigma-B regulation protein RsbU (phosphoserine phosphatase)
MMTDSAFARTQAAHTLMDQLFAPTRAPIAGVEYAVRYRFGEHVGGDVADVFDCGDDGVFISLADIEGNGHEAAVHAAMVKYGIRAYACAHRCPSAVLRDLNALYARNCKSEGTESFATLFLGLVESDRRSMTYVCAGYETAMLLYPNGFCEMLPASGPLVGVLDDDEAQFKQRTIELPASVTLLAVSDGVTEARLGHKHFGLARIRQLVSEQARAGRGLDELVGAIIDAAAAFARGKIFDDMAVLAVRFTGRDNSR